MSTFSDPYNSPEAGFLFVADDAQAAVWELDKSGNMVSEMNMGSDMMPQGAKIRKDLSSGYVGRHKFTGAHTHCDKKLNVNFILDLYIYLLLFLGLLSLFNGLG